METVKTTFQFAFNKHVVYFISFMKRLSVFVALFFLAAGILAANAFFSNLRQANGAPPYDASGTDNVSLFEEQAMITNWKRPEGPAKVALQVGHWKTDDVPEELHKLRGNTGASGGENPNGK